MRVGAVETLFCYIYTQSNVHENSTYIFYYITHTNTHSDLASIRHAISLYMSRAVSVVLVGDKKSILAINHKSFKSSLTVQFCIEFRAVYCIAIMVKSNKNCILALIDKIVDVTFYCVFRELGASHILYTYTYT